MILWEQCRKLFSRRAPTLKNSLREAILCFARWIARTKERRADRRAWTGSICKMPPLRAAICCFVYQDRKELRGELFAFSRVESQIATRGAICFFARFSRGQRSIPLALALAKLGSSHASRASLSPLLRGCFSHVKSRAVKERYSRVAEEHRKMLPLRKQFAFARVRSRGIKEGVLKNVNALFVRKNVEFI